jgi:hypothetical protein
MTVTYLRAKDINFRKKAVDITLSLDSDYWDNEEEKIYAIKKLIDSVIELTGDERIYREVFELDYENLFEKIKIEGKYRFKR